MCQLVLFFNLISMEYHENYDRYVEMIVSHPNYKGLYYDRRSDGRVNWVVTGKSPKGQLRQQWWDKKCAELGVPIQKGCYAKVARMIHPTGVHVCQTCGKERSIFYEYPTLNTLKQLNRILCIDINQTDYTIREIVQRFCKTQSQIDSLAIYLGLPIGLSKQDFISYIYEDLVQKESSRFSPGVMCNPPDRFNGFHSYALCCRKSKDTGRHDANMKTYTQDRRAYEEWSDGDYNFANRLMGEFHKAEPMECPMCGRIDEMTADHIGPISLGFCHSKYFTPLCRSCNSAKNNRFTKEDVDKLIALEQDGNQVISWHSKHIWDLLKNRISNDTDAKKASSIMAKCHQNILFVLSLLHLEGCDAFLMRYLHPEYSLYDYRFADLDLNNLSKLRVIKTPLESKNKQKNQQRYIRIAFESLDEFGRKDNRKNALLYDNDSKEIKNIILAVRELRYEEADVLLNTLFNSLSDRIFEEEWDNKMYETKDNQIRLVADGY